MPENEEKTIAEEIEEIVDKSVGKIPPVEFPDVQKVEVTNLPEEKERPEVESVRVTNFDDLKIPEPKVTVNVPDQPAPVVNVENDLTELLEAVRENKVTLQPTDLTPLSEALTILTEEVKKTKNVTVRGGGAVGPSKIHITRTKDGKAINPSVAVGDGDTVDRETASATGDPVGSVMMGTDFDNKARYVGVLGGKMETVDNFTYLLKEIVSELKIISTHLEFLTDVKVENVSKE